MTSAVLPVDSVREELLRALSARGRVVLSSPTGSGKSTRVPLWFESDLRVLVVQPRRVAARALAGFVAETAGSALGDEVGYAVRFDAKMSESSRVVFVTTGMALQWMQRDGLAAFDVVILDEFHERRWELDLLLALVLRGRARGGHKVVVMSATLDADAVADAIGGEHVSSAGRTFPVSVRYSASSGGPSSEALPERVVAAVRAEWDGSDGDVLVFLPGKGEIRGVRERLPAALATASVEVHGGVPPSELARAFRSGGSRRIYLATNVAETSVTLPGVRVVIDSGLARTRLHRAGRSVLALEGIAQASMDQRAGRAGRVAAGACVRLWSERHRAREHDAPELERIQLDEVVARAASCGVPAHQFADLPWITPPPTFAVDEATDRLVGLGVLDGHGELTVAGRSAATLPVGVSEAQLLVGASPTLLPDLIDILAVVNGWRRMMRPAVGDDVVRERARLFEGARHEVERAVRVIRLGDARRHGLHSDGLREARKSATQLRQLLKVEASSEPTLADERALALHVLRRWPDAGFVARERALRRRVDNAPAPNGEPWGNGDIELRVRVEVARGQSAVAGVVFDQEWLGDGGTGARGVGGLVLPCSYDVLCEAGLGVSEVGTVRVSRRRGSTRVEGVVTTELAGVVIGDAERRLSGAALLDAIPDLVQRGSLWKGAWDAVTDALHVWDLARAIDRLEVPPPPDTSEYLRARVEELGVREPGDLDLVETDDLVPDVERITGVPSWDLERIAADFPRSWQWQDGVYTCDVRAAAGRVVMTADNKVARRAKDPPANLLPSFRGFAVTLVNGSRQVRLR